MNAPEQPPESFPATLRDWERTLTHSLLRAHGGKADPIRSFEITPEMLALHCGLAVEHAAGAERAFKRALVSDPHLHWCLQNGTYWTPSAEMPNCIAYLALSLLVDSLLDGQYEGNGDYRNKLAQWLGTSRSLMNLRGIATMWRELEAWLNGRVDAGAPFRRLILPEIPKSWTHIGYTRYLSFPTKRDVTLLRKLVERDPSAAADATKLILLLDPMVRNSAVSIGLRNAFEDFRVALRAGIASVDHRFWRLVTHARQLAGQRSAPHATLLMEFDEDGVRHYRIKATGASNDAFPPDLGNAVASPALGTSANLGPSIRRGILFLRSSGLASWTALGEPPLGIGPFHVAVAERHIRLASGALARFERSGTWHLTVEPVSPGTLSDILGRIGLRNAKETVREIDLVDGVRVGRAWLGLPRYLPHVEGANGEVDVRRSSDGSISTLTCVSGALVAEGPIDGDFIIGDKAGNWSRRASFVAVADTHAKRDGAAYSLPAQEEWRVSSGLRIDRAEATEATWDERHYDYQDMLEALYASARSGIGEADAIAIVDRVAGRKTWDILRTLQESTFLEARLRERWRGRVFTLEHPTLTEIAISGQSAVVVSGALAMRLENDFRETVILQGGAPFRRLGERSHAPAVIGAIGIDATTLADALGWAILKAPCLPDGTAANRLIETKVVGESYIGASSWDWSLGRFREGGVAGGAVSLVRFMHPGGRDHDLYRVTGKRQHTFTSRHAAIVDAHIQAGRPLFRLEGNAIMRLSVEGALPLEIAKALRLRNLTNGGAAADGWNYALAPQDCPWLARLMPGLIDGVHYSDDADPALGHRRRRGARRPLWIDGSLAA